MYEINGTSIKMTKGDSMYAEIGIYKKSDGEAYEPQTGDVIKFGVKKSSKDEQCVIEKILDNETLILHLEPNDTKNLAVGDYVYDLELTFANGDVDTFVNNASLKLVSENV